MFSPAAASTGAGLDQPVPGTYRLTRAPASSLSEEAPGANPVWRAAADAASQSRYTPPPLGSYARPPPNLNPCNEACVGSAAAEFPLPGTLVETAVREFAKRPPVAVRLNRCRRGRRRGRIRECW